MSEKDIPKKEEDTSKVSYTPASLEEDLKSMDKTYFDTSTIRDKIIDKLTPIALDMEITPDDVVDRESAAALDSKLNVINTLTNLLDAKDKAIKTKIEIKTKQKELLENGKQAEAFVTALSEFTKEKSRQHKEQAMSKSTEKLEARIEDKQITPINETELRSDPQDLR